MPLSVVRLCTLVPAIAAAVLSLPQDASPAEVRRELEALRAENQALASRNEILQATIQELESRVAALQEQLAEASRRAAAPQDVAPPEPRANGTPEPRPLPSDPLAAPAAMLAHLQRSYAREFTGLPLATERQRSEFADRVRRWCTRMSQEVRGTPTWLVQVSPPQQAAGRRYEAHLLVLDRATLEPIGEPFRVDLPQAVAERIAGSDYPAWDATVLFAAEPMFDADRRVPGPVDYPTLIGPYAEFGFALDWRGLEGVPPERFRPRSSGGSD